MLPFFHISTSRQNTNVFVIKCLLAVYHLLSPPENCFFEDICTKQTLFLLCWMLHRDSAPSPGNTISSYRLTFWKPCLCGVRELALVWTPGQSVPSKISTVYCSQEHKFMCQNSTDLTEKIYTDSIQVKWADGLISYSSYAPDVRWIRRLNWAKMLFPVSFSMSV